MHGTESSIEEMNEMQVFETLQRDLDNRKDRISGAWLNSAVDDVGNLQAANDKADIDEQAYQCNIRGPSLA